MKRKVKKFAGNESSVVRTRTDAEFAEDSKFGGYGRYMPKGKEYTLDEAKEKISGFFGGKSKAKEETAPVEQRPKATLGYGDMDGRMPAESTWSGDQSPKAKAKAAPEPETKAETKANSVDFSKYDTESYKPKSSTSTTGGSTSTTGSGSKGSVAKPNNNSSSYAPPQKNTNKNNVVPDNYKDIFKDISPKNIQEERRRIAMKKIKNDKATLENRKEYGMKKGGMVKSASARGDGIAQRGKTKGRMC